MQRRAGDAARLEAAEQRSRSRGGARHEAGGGTLPTWGRSREDGSEAESATEAQAAARLLYPQ